MGRSVAEVGYPSRQISTTAEREEEVRPSGSEKLVDPSPRLGSGHISLSDVLFLGDASYGRCLFEILNSSISNSSYRVVNFSLGCGAVGRKGYDRECQGCV